MSCVFKCVVFVNIYIYMDFVYGFRAPTRKVVRMLAPINQLFNDESIAVQIDFWMFIRGISHGFNGTHDKLVMARNLKDIL